MAGLEQHAVMLGPEQSAHQSLIGGASMRPALCCQDCTKQEAPSCKHVQQVSSTHAPSRRCADQLTAALPPTCPRSLPDACGPGCLLACNRSSNTNQLPHSFRHRSSTWFYSSSVARLPACVGEVVLIYYKPAVAMSQHVSPLHVQIARREQRILRLHAALVADAETLCAAHLCSMSVPCKALRHLSWWCATSLGCPSL